MIPYIGESVYVIRLDFEGSVEVVNGKVTGSHQIGGRVRYAIMTRYGTIFRYPREIFGGKKDVYQRIDDEFTRY